MSDLLTGPWPLGWSIVVFVVVGVLTVLGSVRLAVLGDRLADRTGWGEALFGAVFFGVVTSLSGIVMTAATALADQPQLAYGNAVGGIAAQTLAIAVADAFHRRANLEHAAASLSNVLFGCLLIALLGIALMASFGPDVTVLGVHPASAVMGAFYIGGLRLISDRRRPMWEAVRTRETVVDVPDEPGSPGGGRRSGGLWGEFLGIAALVVLGGWAISVAAETFVNRTDLPPGFVGAGLMGVINALPETATAIAAVRRGAVTLAVAAVIGGNCLDALNLVVGDIAYRGGSLYHAAGDDELFLTAAALVMTTVLLGGLLIRQERGWLRLGFDGVLLFAVYAGTIVILAF
ncbi:sodium:calcium antiporter [Streptomyces radicis]|uniref:Cation transporter n=1 Tax=Streptomyces radicis TaxID=1750517 RepID=A0A3A9W9J0_9ACTN|nr:cation transporter [Streptomyces radicis]RKN09292.1 cation transporter [Streptomyces radicis]RKN23110.1 cation transporter [Streptomyces radicis]